MSYSPSFNRNPRGNYPAHRDAGFVSVQAGTDAYILEDELNEMQWLQNEARATLVRELNHSGFLDLGYTDYTTWFEGVYRDPETYKNYPNAILLHPTSIRALVNGYPIDMFFNDVNNYILNLPAQPTTKTTINSAPGSSRDDLVFLEVWFKVITTSSHIYEYGGEVNDTLTNDLIDMRIGNETTQRIQLRWNLRVQQDVNFNTFPEGFQRTGDTMGGSPNPLCDLSSPNGTWVYHQPNPNDDPNAPVELWEQKGLYIAGDGSYGAQQGLGSVTGYSYAIPLFRVRRRNNQSYDTINNPFGAVVYVKQNDATQTTQYSTNTTTFNLQGTVDLNVGQYVSINGALDTYISNITAINTNNNTITVANGLPRAQTLNYVESVSNRPDGLFSNIIDFSDIIDLRHTLVHDINLNLMLKNGLDNLLRNENTTAIQTTYVRDFIGLPTFTDDSYTLLLAHFNNNTSATANGNNVTSQGVVSTWGYADAPCETGVNIPYVSTSTSSAFYYNVNIPSNITSFTFETLFKPEWNTLGSYGIITLADLSMNRNLSLDFNTLTSQFECYFNTPGGLTIITWPVTRSMASEFVNATIWHKMALSFSSTGNVNLVVDNLNLTPTDGVSNLYPGPFATNVVSVFTGFSLDTGTTLGGMFDELRISSILRSETQLISNFSAYELDHIVRGADGVHGQWSDIENGGLTYVPNNSEALVYYNGNSIPEYINTSILNWDPTSVVVTNDPAGIQDSSALGYNVDSVSNGGTSITFDTPVSVPTGQFLTTMNATQVYNNNTEQYVPVTLAINNSTYDVTAYFNTNIASGTEFTYGYTYGDEHVHITPSIKGLQIHEWTMETYGIQYLNNPSVVPVLAPASGGTLVGGSGTMYYVTYTWSTEYGETMASPEASILLINTQDAITVTTPSIPAGAYNVNVYIGYGSGTEELYARATTNVITITSMPSDANNSPQGNTAQVTNHLLPLSNASTVSKVYGVNHIRITPNGSNVSYVITQSGLSDSAPGSPGFNVPSWNITNSTGTTITGTTVTVPTTGAGTNITLPTTNVFVNFNGNLPDGTIVDIIYEYEVIPAITDNIVVTYQTTPYQGLIGNELALTSLSNLPVIAVLDHMLINTIGTGAIFEPHTPQLYNYRYTGASTRMPMGVISTTTNTGPQLNNELLGSPISFVNDATSFASGVGNVTTLRMVPYDSGVVSYNNSTSLNGLFSLVGNLITNIPPSLIIPHGVTINGNMFITPSGDDSNVVVYCPQAFTTTFAKQVIFAALVYLKNGDNTTNLNSEIMLLICSRVDNTNTASIGFDTGWTDVAFDFYHINGRPLLH